MTDLWNSLYFQTLARNNTSIHSDERVFPMIGRAERSPELAAQVTVE